MRGGAIVHFASGQSLSGDPSTAETSVFINAEILVRLFLKRSFKKVLLYTEAPKHRLVEQEISEYPQFFSRCVCGGGVAGAGGGALRGGGHRRDRLSPFSLHLYSLIPPPFSIFQPLFSISSVSLSFHPSPSLLPPASVVHFQSD